MKQLQITLTKEMLTAAKYHGWYQAPFSMDEDFPKRLVREDPIAVALQPAFPGIIFLGGHCSWNGERFYHTGEMKDFKDLWDNTGFEERSNLPEVKLIMNVGGHAERIEAMNIPHLKVLEVSKIGGLLRSLSRLIGILIDASSYKRIETSCDYSSQGIKYM